MATYTNIKDIAARVPLTVDPSQQAVAYSTPSFKQGADGSPAYYAGTVLGGQTAGAFADNAGAIVLNYQDGNGGYYGYDEFGNVEYITVSSGQDQADYQAFNAAHPWIQCLSNGSMVYYPFTEGFFLLDNGSYLSLDNATSPGLPVGENAGQQAAGQGGAGDTGGQGSGAGAGSGTGSGLLNVGAGGGGVNPFSPVDLSGLLSNPVGQLVVGGLAIWALLAALAAAGKKKSNGK